MNQFVQALRDGEPRAVQAADRLLRNMGRMGDLHPRELHALEHVAAGGNAGPFKDRLTTARLKLGARNTTHAVALAIKQGHIR